MAAKQPSEYDKKYEQPFIFIESGLLGETLTVVSPEGILQDIFSRTYSVGIDPPLTLDLKLFVTTFGFSFRLNLFSLLGIVLGFYVYKQA